MDPVFASVPAFKESRLASLFADFEPLQTLNPEGYDANVAAWQALLVQCLAQHTFGSSFTLPGEKLPARLSHPTHGAPKSLPAVLDRLVQSKTVLPLSIYKAWPIVSPSSLAGYLSPSGVWQRSVGSLKTALYSCKTPSSAVKPEALVHWPSLVAQADTIYRAVRAKVEKSGQYTAALLDFSSWSALVRSVDAHLSPDDIEALTVYLSRDAGKILSAPDPQNPARTLVKVADKGKISQDDVGIINVKASIASVQNRVASLELRLHSDIPARLQTLLASSSKERDARLKQALRHKAATAAALDRAAELLGKLTAVVDRIDEAQSNAATFESLRTAKSVLASYNEQVSLDDINSLTKELNEQMALTDEISDSLAMPTEENDDIETELEMLEKEYEDSKKKTASSEAPDGKAPEKFTDGKTPEKLPDVPHHSPKVPDTKADSAEDLVGGLANLNIAQPEKLATA